jgi:hypothetical protein
VTTVATEVVRFLLVGHPQTPRPRLRMSSVPSFRSSQSLDLRPFPVTKVEYVHITVLLVLLLYGAYLH